MSWQQRSVVGKATSWGAVQVSQLHHSSPGLQLGVRRSERKVNITLSPTLSAYVLDRFSIKSTMASLLLRTTISRSKSRKYRTSVAFRGQPQNSGGQNDFRAYHDDWPTK